MKPSEQALNIVEQAIAKWLRYEKAKYSDDDLIQPRVLLEELAREVETGAWGGGK